MGAPRLLALLALLAMGAAGASAQCTCTSTTTWLTCEGQSLTAIPNISHCVSLQYL
jgi:hypothetical protein